MLSMSSFTNTTKTVAFYYTLETFAFSCTNYFHFIAFGKNVYSNGFTKIFIYFAIAYFFDYFFGRGLCFGEVIDFSFNGVFFFFVAKCNLECIIPICFNGFLLRDNTRTGLNDGNSSLLTACIKDTGHANLLSNNTF